MSNPIDSITNITSKYGSDVTYEMLALAYTIGYDETIKYLNSRSWKSGNDIIFLQPTLRQQRRDILVDIENLKRRVDITSGLQCRYCKSTQTVVVDYVARSADEPVLVKVLCRDCGKATVIG
jgi:DNA-directed RNA polymerase subunit M/transcription elongation factor TFIIS